PSAHAEARSKPLTDYRSWPDSEVVCRRCPETGRSDPRGDPGSKGFDARLVFGVEPCGLRTVEVDHGDDGTIPQHRHDEFRAAGGIAGDMAREGMHVLHPLRPALACRGAADALAERDADTRRFAAERAKHQLFADQPVEAGPVQIRNQLPDQRRKIGHVGYAVGLSRRQGVGSRDQLCVELGLGQGGGGGEVIHALAVAAEGVAAKRAFAYPVGMNVLKKIAIGLVVVIAVLGLAGWWLLRGHTAEYSVEDVTGTDPVLAQPNKETI